MEQISAFGFKIPQIAITGRTGWEGDLGLTTAKMMKGYWKKNRAKPKKATVAAIAHAAKIAGMISEHHKNKKAKSFKMLLKKSKIRMAQ